VSRARKNEDEMAKFVLELKFDKDNERRLAVRPAHRQYLRMLLDQEKLFMAGPWSDDGGSMIIYEVKDKAEADALLMADPYTAADVVSVVALREWTPILPS
jgi:uncharacterized protein